MARMINYHFAKPFKNLIAKIIRPKGIQFDQI